MSVVVRASSLLPGLERWCTIRIGNRCLVVERVESTAGVDLGPQAAPAFPASIGTVPATTRLRSPGTRSLRLALVLLGLAAVGFAAFEVALYVFGSVEPLWLLIVFVLLGVEYAIAGVWAWARRPSNGTGSLLYACGLALLLSALSNATVPALAVVGYVTGQLPIGILIHLLLAFPSGRLRSRRRRGLVATGYVATVVLTAPAYLFAGDQSGPAALSIADRPDLVALGNGIHNVFALVVFVLAVGVLVRQTRRATAGQRRVLALVTGYGAVTIAFLMFSSLIIWRLVDMTPVTLFMLQCPIVAGLPIAFAAGVLRGGFARTGEIEELSDWLGTADGARPGLREALATTLGDTSLQLLFWLPESARYVDANATAAQLPAGDSGRAAVEVTLGPTRVGAIVYDATLIADPELVRSAGRVVALALERDRLTAELLASHAALRDSRARLVQAGDDERRRIARDLHDGLQGRLVVLAMRAGRIAAEPTAPHPLHLEAVNLRIGLQGAIAELRSLVHGVLPALLIERGLGAATEELLDAAPVRTCLDVWDAEARLPASVETVGYFVVAEALTNVIKHARADAVAVRLCCGNGSLEIEIRDNGVGGASIDDGTGLRGVADRVDVLGGRLHIDSRPGNGTRLIAELPCGS